jgi:hypothetical protein
MSNLIDKDIITLALDHEAKYFDKKQDGPSPADFGDFSPINEEDISCLVMDDDKETRGIIDINGRLIDAEMESITRKSINMLDPILAICKDLAKIKDK